MLPDYTKQIARPFPHKVEIGAATFKKGERSVRLHFRNSNGSFNRGSPEVPMGCVVELVEAVAENDELEIAEMTQIIDALTASIQRLEAEQAEAQPEAEITEAL